MMLAVSGLGFDYGERRVLSDVDLSATAGELIGIVGPNGAGKSTLLRCIAGLLRPTAGRIEIAGRDVTRYDRQSLARAVAFVPQHAGAPPSLPVADIVALGRAPHRRPGSGPHDREIVLRMLARFDLEALALRPVAQLSGGERQRVVIARALAQQAPLLILDEPTSNLDLRHQADAMRLLRHATADHGIAALVAVHDLALAARYCDRLALVAGGGIAAVGTWRAVLTPDTIAAAYGTRAIVGAVDGLPYIIPVDADHVAAGRVASRAA